MKLAVGQRSWNLKERRNEAEILRHWEEDFKSIISCLNRSFCVCLPHSNHTLFVRYCLV